MDSKLSWIILNVHAVISVLSSEYHLGLYRWKLLTVNICITIKVVHIIFICHCTKWCYRSLFFIPVKSIQTKVPALATLASYSNEKKIQTESGMILLDQSCWVCANRGRVCAWLLALHYMRQDECILMAKGFNVLPCFVERLALDD